MEKILELPKVSILTPTFNRSSFSPLAIKNILDTEYPKEKIEWIILDDSNDGSSWEEILKENKHLLPKYIYLQREKKMNISQKRNYLCKNSSNPILVFMDDDDIYLPQHLINRVRPLINNTRIGLIGSKDMLLYFGYDNTYRWKMNNENKNMHEGTFAFRKPFWKKNNFSENDRKAEGVNFISGREDKVMHLSCSDVMIMCGHGDNTIPKDIFFNYLKEWKLSHIPDNIKTKINHYNSLF